MGGWRTVIIRKRCQLSYKLDYLTIRQASERERIYLDEIDCLLVESCATFFNSGLAEELSNRKISVIFCDRYHNPISQLLPLNGSFDARKKIIAQVGWSEESKNRLWKFIVRDKIIKQAEVLQWYKPNANDHEKLFKLATQVEVADDTNTEAQAARHYFMKLFGTDFNRKDKKRAENAALNYGYSILLSTFNRTIIANGYLTQLGIHHIGNENAFNLSCDLMEPFRPLIDKYLFEKDLWDLNPTTKVNITDILNTQVIIDGNKQYLTNAISIYCKDCLDSLSNENVEGIKGYELI